MATIKLHTEGEYRNAMKVVEDWMANQQRPVPRNFDELVDAIVEYEKIHYPI